MPPRVRTEGTLASRVVIVELALKVKAGGLVGDGCEVGLVDLSSPRVRAEGSLALGLQVAALGRTDARVVMLNFS